MGAAESQLNNMRRDSVRSLFREGDSQGHSGSELERRYSNSSQPGRHTSSSTTKTNNSANSRPSMRTSVNGALRTATNLFRNRVKRDGDSSRIDEDVFFLLNNGNLDTSLMGEAIAAAGTVRQMQTNVYSWGRGDCGQLMDDKGPVELRSNPRAANRLTKYGIVKIACSVLHSIAVSSTGVLIGSGENREGQLEPHRGQGSFDKPHMIENDAIQNKKIVDVSCGLYHSVVLTEDGYTLSFGNNEFGQLGHSPDSRVNVIPRVVLTNHNAVQIACTERATFILTAQGKVFSCGLGEQGTLGHGDKVTRKTPTQVKGLLDGTPICHISAGAMHVVALSVTGRVYSWGKNRNGQLGISTDQKTAILSPMGIDYFNRSSKRSGKSKSEKKAPATVRLSAVACGDAHTVFLSTKGYVFACGKGVDGQLGVEIAKLADSKFVSPPVYLRELPRASQIACGDNHTLVLTVKGQVYAFGKNSNGQVGLPEQQDFVERPYHISSLDGQGVILIQAGGQHSFAISDTVKSRIHREDQPYEEILANLTRESQYIRSQQLSYRPVNRLGLDVVYQLVGDIKQTSKPDFGTLKKVMQASLFDMTTLNASFLTNPVDERHRSRMADPPTKTANPSGVDVKSAVKAFDLITKALSMKGHGRDLDNMRRKLNKLIKQLRNAASKIRCADQLRAYYLLILNPIMVQPRLSKEYKEFIVVLDHLAPSAKVTLFLWIEKEFPKDRFNDLLVAPALARLDPYIAQLNWTPESIALCRYLKRLHDINDHVAEKKGKSIVNYEAFNSKVPSEFGDHDLGTQYLNWRSSPRTADNGSHEEGEFFLLQFPFLLSADAKRRLMQLEDQAAMYRNAMFTAMTGNNPYFILVVNRENILMDTISQLLHAKSYELRKPLRVKFQGEEGLDAGGVKKEFFQLLSLQLFNPDFGMFKENEETNQLWFNPYGVAFASSSSSQDLSEFVLVGALLGLSIFNDTLLNVSFPLLIYRWMLGQTPQISLRELRKLDPSLAKGLKQMLEYKNDDFEDVFCQSFEISYDFFGERRTKELKPGGSDIPVTRENVKEYANLYCSYILRDSIENMARAFLKGFGMVVHMNSPALQLFRAEELELLVTGTQELDFESLQAKTSYEGYHDSSQTVKDFWQVVHILPQEKKALLLQFATGSPKAPVGGLASPKFKFKIQRAGPDSNQLPTAHTCFNTILLPDYKNREKLLNRLLLAIENAEGFGLE